MSREKSFTTQPFGNSSIKSYFLAPGEKTQALSYDTKNTFITFYTLIERQFNTKIKCVQFDLGREYKPLAQYLTSYSILFRHICPHTNKNNGRVEQKHRKIIENGLTLLAHSGMPFKFWWLAFQTSGQLSNRLLTYTLES